MFLVSSVRLVAGLWQIKRAADPGVGSAALEGADLILDQAG
ncbi:hypothetical protein M271_17975 [Streptomyces rapamycinicus NRRL 5491]|uniref:Uncharacterized protein n=1 Tax=Streptomyces iranensis TaxID=576784 RepID=A0A060ZKU0_9ACTN|nr:hypothetical protein M271_17975 [Streptomyces rapamycinicus NRRL 5491]CDR06705.1 predicted protein [Streptomyces iranensis]